MTGNLDDKNSFPHKWSLTNRQVANIRKAFSNHLSTDIKLLKIQSSKTVQSGGFFGRLLGQLLKTSLPLMKNILQPLAEKFLIPLELTAAASAAGAWTHKKIWGSSTRTIIISNEEMEDIIKIVKSLEDPTLFLSGVSKTI